MSRMIEQVARALHSRFGMTEGESREYARAAIEAMREPTEAMLRRAFIAMNETPGGTWKRLKAEGATPRRLFDAKMAPRYRAMIDGALEDPA